MTTETMRPASTPTQQHLPRGLVPGLLTIVAAAVQGDGALITAAHRGSSTVSDEQLAFPWAGSTAVTTSLIWGATQVLLVIGLVAFARSGAAAGRSGRVGGRLAVVGAGVYVLAHGLSVVGYDAALDDPIAVGVIACFGVGTVLSAVGLLLAGAATRRSGVWSGWRRSAPLFLGVWMVAMIPLQFTPALPVAVGVYAVALVALGVAMLVEGPSPAPPVSAKMGG